MRTARSIIDKCLEGHTPRSIIESVEDEAPDVASVRLALLHDVQHFGICAKHVRGLRESIELRLPAGFPRSRKSDLLRTLSVYDSTYPEVPIIINEGSSVTV